MEIPNPESREECWDAARTATVEPTKGSMDFEKLYTSVASPPTAEEVEGAKAKELNQISVKQMEDPEGSGMVELDTLFIAGSAVVARTVAVYDTGSSLNLCNLDWANRWLRQGGTWATRNVVQRFQLADGTVSTVRTVAIDVAVRLGLKGGELGPAVSARFWGVPDLKFPCIVGREFAQDHGVQHGEASTQEARPAYFTYEPQLNLLRIARDERTEADETRIWEVPDLAEMSEAELKPEDQLIQLDSAVAMLMNMHVESRAARAAEPSPAGGEGVRELHRKKPARLSGCAKRRRKREHQLNQMWKQLNESDKENLQPDAVSLERLLQSESQAELTRESQEYVSKLMKDHEKLFEPRNYDPKAKPHVVDGVKIAFDIEEKESGIRYYRSPKPMRLGLAGEARVAEAVEALINKGVLIKARNPRHVSNVFVVPKKNPDGTTKAWRLVVNYAPLNRLTCAKHGTIPAISEIWDRLAKAKILTAVDVSESFYALVTTERARELLPVRTPVGIYTFARAPMGAQGSPAVLNELVNALLGDYMFGPEAMVCSYMDDLIVFTNEDSPQKHADALDKVFRILKSAELNLNQKKVQYFKRYARVLGCIVGAGERRICSEKLGGLLELQPPRNVNELRRFLGCMSASRDFIPNFSELAHSLNTLLKKGVEYRWGKEQEISFMRLRKALCSPPVLRLPIAEATGFRLSTDASDIAIGGVLEQMQPADEGSEDMTWRTIGYYSRSLRGAELNYSAGDKELTALHQSLKHWGGLLRYAQTQIEVDNKALSYLLTKEESLRSPREWRLAEFLTGFDISLKHIPGVSNTRPDFLSRLPGTALGPAVILDLAAGCGSTLRALAILARKGLIRSDKQLIQYVAVEANPTARAVIKKMYESVAREFPRLFATNDTTGIFPLGHDIRTIADNARVRKKPFRVDLLLASPPCQPFSRANPRAKGMEDDRELFTPVVDLIHVLLATNSQLRWCCENVDFGKEEGEQAPFPTLRKARKQVDDLFASLPGTRTATYDMSRFVPQRRSRTFWTNIPASHETSLPEEGAAGSYADLLTRMGRGKPVRENRFAATNMAWAKSKIHLDGLNDYVDHTGVTQRASEDWELQEALSGLDPGDTDIKIKGEQIADKDRQRLLGNIWVPPCMAHWIQAAWTRKAILTDGVDSNFLLIQAGGGIQPLTGFSGTVTDFVNRLRSAMQEEADFSATCETAVGGGKGVVAKTLDGVKLYKDEKGRWKIPEGASAPARELRHAVMQAVHEWGHRGGQACYDVLREVVTWKGMEAAVKDYAASCPRCQISKNNRARRADQLRPTPYPRKAGVSVSMDLLELPAAKGKWAGRDVTCDMLLVIRDRMSKLVKLLPTKKEGLTSENLACIFETQVLPLWPNLEEVYSDRDKRYVGRAFQLLVKREGLKSKKTVAYRPQTDGATERAIQSVLETLRGELAPVEESSNRHPRVEVPTWLELIPTVERVMNSYPHSSTGVSPYMLATGHEPTHPFHEIVRERDEPAEDERTYLERQAKILERAYTVAFRTMEARQEAMRKRYAPSKSPPLQVGQRVLVRAQRRGVAEKLLTRAYGPFEILEARHPVYKLQRDGPNQTHTFNRDQLIPYRESGDGTDEVPMPQILESPRALIRRRGPAQVHRVDWDHGRNVPPVYIVSWRHGGQRRAVHEDELVSAYTPENEVPDAVKAYLQRRNFAELTHEHVPEEGRHEHYQAYRSHYDLMVDKSRGAIAPQYEPSGNSATSPGGWVLTAECRARAAYLRNRGVEASESEVEEEEGHVTNEQVTREELVRQREELLRQTRERAAPAVHPVGSDKWNAEMAKRREQAEMAKLREQAAAQGRLLRTQVGLPTETPAWGPRRKLAAEVTEPETEGETEAPSSPEAEVESTELEDDGEKMMEDTFDTPSVQDAPAEATDHEASNDDGSEGPSTDADAANEGDPETRYSLRPRDPETGCVVRTSGTEAAPESLMVVGTERPSEVKTAAGVDFFHPFEVRDYLSYLYEADC